MSAIATANGTNGSALMPQNLTDAMRLAELMAKGKMVPEHLRNPSDMMMVIEQAVRWGMSPFAVAQCTGIVKGKLSYEGKLVSAAINSSGILQGRLDYEFHGEGSARAVVASGTIRGETKVREVTVTLASARTENEHWKKSPDQMLTYHAARVWARRHAPEVMLGVYSTEEFEEPRQDGFKGKTIEGEPSPAAESQAVKEVAQIDRWLTKLAFELSAAGTPDEIDAILARDDVHRAQDKLRGEDRDRLQHLIDGAIARGNAMDNGAPVEEPTDAA